MKDGGPAFPVQGMVGHNDQIIYPEPGMTLRDYFAGQALAGLLSSRNEAGAMHFQPEHDAGFCYLIADAMLNAREG